MKAARDNNGVAAAMTNTTDTTASTQSIDTVIS
jgi:hypothetical protein